MHAHGAHGLLHLRAEGHSGGCSEQGPPDSLAPLLSWVIVVGHSEFGLEHSSESTANSQQFPKIEVKEKPRVAYCAHYQKKEL